MTPNVDMSKATNKRIAIMCIEAAKGNPKWGARFSEPDTLATYSIIGKREASHTDVINTRHSSEKARNALSRSIGSAGRRVR